MDLGENWNFFDHGLQSEAILGEAILYFGLPERLEQDEWKSYSSIKNRKSFYPTFEPILQCAIIRNESTMMQYHQHDLEDMDSDLEDLIKKCRKQCLPFDCNIEENDPSTSSQQISYHSFPIGNRKRPAFDLEISKQIPTLLKESTDEDALHAHVLTVRTALTSTQKEVLRQIQSLGQSSQQNVEANVTWLNMSAPRAICFLSKLPLHVLFADVLRFAYMRYSHKNRLNDFLTHCFLTPVVSLGHQIQIKISSLEDVIYFIHDSASPAIKIPTILTATISKQDCVEAISFLLEPTNSSKRIALVSDSITLLSFCSKEMESLLISIPDWNGIVYPILHQTELHSIIAKEQGNYVIPVQRQMSHILSMADIHLMDLDQKEIAEERSASRMSKWLPSGTRLRAKLSDKIQSKPSKSSIWLDRNLFDFKKNTFHNVGMVEVLEPLSLGDDSLSFDTLDIPDRGWKIGEIVQELQSNRQQLSSRVPLKRKSLLFGSKTKLPSTFTKDAHNARESSIINERSQIVPQLPKLEEYQIGSIVNEEEEDLADQTQGSTTAVDQPYEPLPGNKEEKKWQDVRIRMEQSRTNIDVIKQRKRDRRIGRIMENGVEDFSSYDENSPEELFIDAQKLDPTSSEEGKEVVETLQTPRSHATAFTSTTESMPLTPTIAQIPKASKHQEVKEETKEPKSSSSERPRTPIVSSSRFEWLDDVEYMQAQLQRTIERLESENAEQFSSTEQNHEEYARIWQSFCSITPTDRSQFVQENESSLLADDTNANEFDQIEEWRHDVQRRNSNLPSEEEAMTSFFDSHLTTSSNQSIQLKRQKSWNSV